MAPAALEGDSEQLVVLFRLGHHFRAVCGGSGQRFFHQDVLAGLERRSRDGQVEIVGHHDADGVNVIVRK